MYKKSHSHRKDHIAHYLRAQTEALLSQDRSALSGLDASMIATALGLDRANVSRDLNALYHEGLALKLLGKPTRYLHYQALTEFFSDRYIPNTIPLGQHIQDYLGEEAPEEQPTDEPAQPATMVQSQFPSLHFAAAQAESAIHYPVHGLHTLLLGPYGSGKYQFARQMFAYGKAVGRFPPEARLFTFDAHSFSTSPQALIIQLFGCAAGATSASAPARKGLVERAQGSMLLLTEVQSLPFAVQEKLIDLIMYGTFSRFGEAAVSRQCKLMLVATCSQLPDDQSASPLIRYFPMRIPLPSLAERTIHERFLYLYQAFQREAEQLDCEFQVSKDVFYLLLHTTAGGDFVTLSGNVKSVCSMSLRAHLSRTAHRVYPVEYIHLPASVLKAPPTTALSGEIRALLDQYPQESISIHANSIPSALAVPERPGALRPSSMAQAHAGLLFIKNYLDEYLRSASEQAAPAPAQNAALTAHILYCIREDPVLKALGGSDPLIQGLASLLAETMQSDLNDQLLPFPDEFSQADEGLAKLRLLAGGLEHTLCRVFHCPFSEHRLSLVVLYLYFIRSRLTGDPIHLAFLFHGSGVSQGLAEEMHALFGCPAIALPCTPQSTPESVQTSINTAFAHLPEGTQILLFTDAAPFRTIHHYIRQRFGFQVKNICGAPYEAILRIVRSVTRFYYTLDMVEFDAAGPSEAAAPAEAAKSSIMSQAIQGVLAPSLTFLDLKRLLPLLEDALNQINCQFRLHQSDNLSLKFEFHCSHMVERLIRKEPLDYPRLKPFVNAHSAMFRTIGEALQPIAQAFGIKIPTSEIAYLVEIFLSM